MHWVYRDEERIEESAGVDDLTRRYTDEALAFIRNNKDGPFFLYVAHTMAHVVLGVTEPFRGRSQRGLYGDVIEELDASTGEIVDLLKELNLDQDTIVVYTSDTAPGAITPCRNTPPTSPSMPVLPGPCEVPRAPTGKAACVSPQ